MKLTNPKNSEEIESPFATDSAALDELCTLIKRKAFSTDFAYSLRDTCFRYAAKGIALSQGQRFWLHKLAMNAPKAAPQATEQIDLSGLCALLNRAQGKLKRPAIVLAVQSGDEIKVAIAGSASRHRGSVMIASPHFGGAYYGRVTDGGFFPGRDFNPEVGQLLHDLASDPEGTASKHGHLTGKCCFCNRKLEDERSTEVGYGPVCAESFGLKWGKKSRMIAGAVA